MKTLSRYLASGIICILLSIISSCTNHGDIGPIYGIWATDACSRDGQPLPLSQYEEYFWRFQSDLVQISKQRDMYQYNVWTGTWKRQGNTLTLDFAHIPASDPDFPTSIGLLQTSMPMTILSESSSQYILSYTHPSTGTTYLYTLRHL